MAVPAHIGTDPEAPEVNIVLVFLAPFEVRMPLPVGTRTTAGLRAAISKYFSLTPLQTGLLDLRVGTLDDVDKADRIAALFEGPRISNEEIREAASNVDTMCIFGNLLPERGEYLVGPLQATRTYYSRP
jgi:hypothetical protein